MYLISLLIFALGILTLIRPLAIEHNIRRVILKRKWLQILTIAVFAILISSLSFIWYFHPCKKGLVGYDGLFASILVTAILSIWVIFWYRQWTKFTRENHIEYLGKQIIHIGSEDLFTKIIKDINSLDELFALFKNFFKRDDIYDYEKLSDLIYLGEKGHGGDEKKIVH